MKRRQFLCGVSGLAIWPGLSPALCAAPAEGDGGMIILADRLLQACPRRVSAVVVGNAYLEHQISSPKISQVIETLICNLGTPPSMLETMTAIDLRARLRTRTSEDFSAGRTVQLHGWVLGDTEAQLCGLAALCSDRKNVRSG